jgi:hypothetical protein
MHDKGTGSPRQEIRIGVLKRPLAVIWVVKPMRQETKIYVGLGLHKEFCQACVMNKSEKESDSAMIQQ